VKNFILLLWAVSFAGCQPVELVRGKIAEWRGGPTPPAQEPVVNSVPIDLPTVDEDKVIQFTPKEKIISMIEQFNRSPDAAGMEMVLEELGKQRTLLGMTKDVAFISAINGALPQIQIGDTLTVEFLVRLLPLVSGDNLRHVRLMVARIFDNRPLLGLIALSKTNADASCALVLDLPEDVTPETRLTFLENRRSSLESTRPTLASRPTVLAYLETCINQLQAVLPAPVPVDEEPLPSDA
jgi:hypothetical protein